MKLLYLMNDFKGTIKAGDMNDILKSKFSMYYSFSIPFSDGGDGFIDTMEALLKDKFYRRHLIIDNPLRQKKIDAYYLVDGDSCYVESASFIGYKLLQHLDIYHASTFPLGQAFLDILENKDIKHVFIGLGGSSTNDMGAGALYALGACFYNEYDEEIIPDGSNLNLVYKCDFSKLDKRIKDIDVTILSDVKNPLLGDNGATYIYALQKGAKEVDLPILEKGIERLSKFYIDYKGIDMTRVKGSGAAGGLGMMFLSFFNSNIVSGSKFLLDSKEIEKHIEESSLVFTGEGRIDMSSFEGKGSIEILKKVKKINPKAKIVLLCGSIQKEALNTIYNEYDDVLVIPCSDNVFDYDIDLRKKMAINIFEKTLDLNFSSIKEMLK